MRIKTLNPLPEQEHEVFDRAMAEEISFESNQSDGGIKESTKESGIDVNTDTRFMSPKHKAYYEELNKHGFRLLDMSDGFLDGVEDNEIAEFAAKETMMIEEASEAVNGRYKYLSDNLSQLNPSSFIPVPKKHYMGENDAEYMSLGDGEPFEASVHDTQHSEASAHGTQPVVEHVKHAANLEFDVVNGDYQGALDAALKEHPEIGSKYNNWNGHEPNIIAKASSHEVDNPIGRGRELPNIEDNYVDTGIECNI